MKCVIAFSCLLAVASAGYIGNSIAYTSYGSPLAYSTGYTYSAPLTYVAPKTFGYQSASVHPISYTTYGATYGYAKSVPLASEARLVDPVAIAAGAPLPTGDTVEVAAAKAAHFRAHAEETKKFTPVLSYSAPAVTYTNAAPISYVAKTVPFSTQARLVDPVAIAAGAPLPTGDTYEVAAAKAMHFQAHAEAKKMTYSAPTMTYSAPAVTYTNLNVAPVAYGYAKALPLASEARLVDPVAIAAGAPLPTGDTVEVAAAKAAHLSAHAAETRKFSPIVSYTAPLAYGYAKALPLASEARLVDPIAIAAGAPLPTGDTYEVAAAKAAHFQAHAEAKSTHFAGRFKRSPVYAPINYGYGYTGYGYPHTYNYGYSTYGTPYFG